MNVSCPKCQSVFRVDPAKVPARGVRARCSVCAGVFFVGPETAGPEAPAVTTAVAAPPPPVHVMAPTPPAVVPPVAMPVAGPPVASPPRAPAAPAATPAPPAVSPQAPRPAPQVATIPPAPRAAPPAAPPVAAPAAPAARRSMNPFLAQDPATRARRLARALISDLVVYYPAKRAEGLRDGTLKLLFEEDIRKCWEEYSEQVGMEMATSTRFFTEALNEILADGQPVFT